MNEMISPLDVKEKRRISRGQWLALIAALLGWMFDGFEQGIVPLVGRPALVDVLGLETEGKTTVDAVVGVWLGWLTAAFLLGAALGGWFFGWLGDRIGRVRAMIFSVLTYALFTGLCGLIQAPWQMTGLRFLAALGMGGEWALGVALVMESWAPGWRPMLAGLIGAAANVGFLLAAALTRLLSGLQIEVRSGGWRWVFAACALPALLTFFLRVFVPESAKWQHAVATGPRGRLIDIFAPAVIRRTLVGAVLGGIALIGTWGSVQWIVPWVQKITHGNQALAGEAGLWTAFGAILGTLLAALSGRSFSRRKIYFFLCLGSLLICNYIFYWLFRNRTPTSADINAWFFFVVFLVGALTASFYGWFPLYLPELFPTRIRATGQGFCYNAGRLLAVPGALGTGFLMSSSVFNGRYDQAGAIISLVYLAGLVVIWLAPETRGKPLPE
jgi:SHS family sialic acid transporter-like MFS transporter